MGAGDGTLAATEVEDLAYLYVIYEQGDEFPDLLQELDRLP